MATTRVEEETKALKEAHSQVKVLEEVQQITQQIAQAVQQQAHDKIADVVSRCLEAVFEEPYEFRIHFERKRGRTEAKLVFFRDGEEYNPMKDSGGGVVDLAALALRLACLVLSRPAARRLIVLDEPLKFLSEEYRNNVRQMLLTLSKEMGVQFVIVTHIDELKCGTVVRIGR